MLRVSFIGNQSCIDDKVLELKTFDNCVVSGYYEATTQYKNILEFTSLGELIENSDACIILNPNDSTHFLLEKIIKSQISFFIESPFAPNLEEGKKIMNLIHEAQIVAQVSNPDRFNDAFSATIPYFDKPMFIESTRLAPLNEQNKDLSVVMNLMIHDIDILLSVIKSEVKKVHAVGVSVLTNSPDIVNARIDFENGCVANLTASRVSLNNEHKARFFQKDRYLSIDYLLRTSSIFELSNQKKIKNNTTIPVNLGEEDKKYVHVRMPNRKTNNDSELKHFIQCVLKQKNHFCFSKSLSALEIASQLNEKIMVNQTILA